MRYRSLIEKLPVVTFMAGLDESVEELYVSPQIETLLGFTQEEWLENPFLWFQQLHPDDREKWVAGICHAPAPTGRQLPRGVPAVCPGRAGGLGAGRMPDHPR